MATFLNRSRPPVFCPGCTHDIVVKALDSCLASLQLSGQEVAIVTDIGCSGLFDTFFSTHAVHGLHGRALTYSTGLKLSRPELTVITIMGDGGLGIGGAHVLAACRRNLNLNLLILNNFNYGMTGGQFSCTTPSHAHTASGFLNLLEAPLDICTVAAAAGATWVGRASGLDGELSGRIREAIGHNGFSVLDILEICPGRYTKSNSITPGKLAVAATENGPGGEILSNRREEYGEHYRRLAQPDIAGPPPAKPLVRAEGNGHGVAGERNEILILGAAGQFVNTAGELLCYGAMNDGLHTTLKSDYPITVLRGHSICEVIIDPEPVTYTGLITPSFVLCLAQEGVSKRKEIFHHLTPDAVVLKNRTIDVPPTQATIYEIDFSALKISRGEAAICSLAFLAGKNLLLTREALESALHQRFPAKLLEKALQAIAKVLPAGDD